jgi:tetratricopeptide (TPR) repeat protein
MLLDENHPTRQDLESFVLGDLDPEENRRVLRHLLAECAECREAAGSLWQAASGVARTMELPPPAMLEIGAVRSIDPYERSLDRIFGLVRKVHSSLQAERAAAEGLLAELMAQPAGRRRTLVESDRRFRTWGFCEHLIERCQAGRYTAQLEGAELAELSVAVADGLDPSAYTPALLADLRARAWAHLGNARRVLSDLRGAEEAFARAEEHLALGTGDRLERARVLDLKASLRNYQGRLEDATRLLNRAIAIYRRAEQWHLLGRALLNKAHVRIWAGDHEAALDLLRQGLRQIDQERDPKLTLACYHNLAYILSDLGRHGEAAAVVAQARPLYLECGHLIQLQYLEARIAMGEGRLVEAEESLRQVRAAFAEQGMAYDAALATLDLAEVHLRQGRHAELRELGEEMLSIFQAREQYREAIAALILFQKAAEAESVTVGLVHELAGRVQQIRRQVDGPAF